MHLLLVYKQFPGPGVGHAGGQAVYGLMRHLRARGHRLSLVARLRANEETQLAAVMELCEHVYTVPHHKDLSDPRLWAVLKSYLSLRQMARHAQRTLHPDGLIVETMQTAVALIGLEGRRATLRLHDIDWFLFEQQAWEVTGWRRLKARLIAWFLRHAEPWIMRRYAVVATVSQGDARLLAPLRLPALITLPLEPGLNPHVASERLSRPVLAPYVLFVGAMDRAYNQQAVGWFVEQVWPRVRAAVPEASFCVVGNAPPLELLARNGQDGLRVTGFVPDLRPWYEGAAVFVAPLRVSGGLLQKLLDALAMGLPVVATSVSNHGIAAIPGEHLELADTPEAFAEKVIALLRDPVRAAALGRAGQAYVQGHFQLRPALERWERMVSS